MKKVVNKLLKDVEKKKALYARNVEKENIIG